jgi:predicted  nucleic acid-binding Zn-ribbon protein
MEKFNNEVTRTIDKVRDRIKTLEDANSSLRGMLFRAEEQLEAADGTIVQQRREIDRMQAVIDVHGGRG